MDTNIKFYLYCLLGMLLTSLILACEQKEQTKFEQPLRTLENKMGTHFKAVSSFKAPIVEQIDYLFPESLDAIWGATGRDDLGNIYFGTSSHGGIDRTAYLYRYDPITETVSEQGDVLTQLKQLGLYREGMGQNKLHSKIYQADDGYLYFSSFDEEGESEGVNPTWGGHLWRKLPENSNWENVLTTKDALIAVNTNGRYVYALGYWDHVLYQFDTQNTTIKQVIVGSLGQHISRNFLVDVRGHSFVPKVLQNDFNEVEVYLNEYDTGLELIDSYPISSYYKDNLKYNQGIIGYTSMKNGDIIFILNEGDLYLLRFAETGEEKLKHLGKMHPDGQAYIPSLFTFEGESFVAGVGQLKGKSRYEWIIYELNSGVSATRNLSVDMLNSPLLFGSLTKDENGNFYVAGWVKSEDGKTHKPVLLKLTD